MSVHSNHYEDPEEYERDLRSEYAREEYEQTHGIPFYYPENDDPDYQKRKKKVNFGCPTEDYIERKENKDNE